MASYSIIIRKMSLCKLQTRDIHTPPMKVSLINGTGTHPFTPHDTLLVVIIINWFYKNDCYSVYCHYLQGNIISDFILKVSRRKEVQVYTNGLFQVSFGVFFSLVNNAMNQLKKNAFNRELKTIVMRSRSTQGSL